MAKREYMFYLFAVPKPVKTEAERLAKRTLNIKSDVFTNEHNNYCFLVLFTSNRKMIDRLLNNLVEAIPETRYVKKPIGQSIGFAIQSLLSNQ